MGLSATTELLVLVNMVVNTWSGLTNLVVSADSMNMIETILDKFGHSQNIIYNFRQQLQGTRTLSKVIYDES